MQNKSKIIEMRCKIVTVKGEEKRIWEKKAALNFSSESHFGDVIQFMDDMKLILRKVKKARKDEAEISFEICEYVYVSTENIVDGHTEEFDLWHIRDLDDIDLDKEEGGIYLVPDERYTRKGRDMFIPWKDPMDGIRYTLG